MNNSLYNDIYFIYTLSEVYERKMALNLLDFLPFCMNVEEGNYLHKEMGIYKIYFINEYTFDLYTDIRILLRNNIEKIHELSGCKFTININRYYSKNKLNGERLFIMKAPIYFNIKMKNIFINSVYDSYYIYDIDVINSWIKLDVSLHLEKCCLYLSINEININDIYKFLILWVNSVLKNQNIVIDRFSIYILDIGYEDRVKEVNKMIISYEEYIIKKSNLLDHKQLKNCEICFHTLI